MLGIILLSCLGKASFVKTFQKFDPYEILDVSPTATTKQIKKAYRTLARLLHPDNNPGDPEATTKFQLVNKAMRCLTDPEVMEKCK
jgi:curved DNA-binding protein CbpA